MAVDRWPVSPMGNDGDPLIREMMTRIQNLRGDLGRIAQDASNGYGGAASSINGLQGQVNTIQTTVDATAAIVARLDALSVLASDTDSNGVTGFTGFSASGFRPAVTIATPTGKLEVQFGGSLNSGEGFFVYSIVEVSSGTVYVNRATLQTDPTQRIAISGGASFAPSGYRTAIVSGLPVGSDLLVTLEYYASSTFTYFFGGSILARPSP